MSTRRTGQRGPQFLGVTTATEGAHGMERTINLSLDDPERVVEVIPADGIEWESTGTAGEAGGWLGNATEADRQALRLAARQASADGHALRVSFPSVMTFILGYDGRRFLLHVPHDHDTTNGCCDICGRWASD